MYTFHIIEIYITLGKMIYYPYTRDTVSLQLSVEHVMKQYLKYKITLWIKILKSMVMFFYHVILLV